MNIEGIIGKKVKAVFFTGGVNFEGEVVGYMANPTYVIRLADGSIRHWSESLVRFEDDVK